MDAIQQVVSRIVEQNGTISQSSKLCTICGADVPAIEVEVLGMKRWVQPKCQCEVDAKMAEYKQIEKAKEENEMRSLFAISNIGEKYTQATFDQFIIREGSRKAFKAACHYADYFDEFGYESILLWGDPGNGKTMLAACVHNVLEKKGKHVVFISMPDLLSKIKATFNRENKETEAQIMKALIACDLLIIDDLGAEKTTDWVQEKVFEIIDARYRRQKPILATTNLKVSELVGQLGARACDRLIEMSQPIKNEATSYRQEKAKSRVSRFTAILEGD